MDEKYNSYIEIQKLFVYFQNIINNFNEDNHERNRRQGSYIKRQGEIGLLIRGDWVK